MQSQQIDRQPTLRLEPSHPLALLDHAIHRIFSSSEEETRLQRARRDMGQEVDGLSDEELETQLIELQYLIDYWLDGFEQQLFDGQTLRQLLGQG
jgi:hypothetical protein